MKKQKKTAMVRYNKHQDAFELYIRDADGDWALCCSSKCRAVEGETEKTHIHFSFLKEVLRCIELGYDVIEK